MSQQMGDRIGLSADGIARIRRLPLGMLRSLSMDHAHFEIRPITPADNTAVAAIIRGVMPEFGAGGPGFAIHDPEVSAMAEAYTGPRAAYFVITRNAEVMG